MTSHSKHLIILLILTLGIHGLSIGQCKRFTKKFCFPELNPYTHNGQFNSTELMPGEAAEINMNFNAGKKYRLYVCHQENMGTIKYRVLDKHQKVLYVNTESEVPYWDFQLENSQQLTLEVSMTEKEHKDQIVGAACISILVGFQ